jgi:hypothetical protein
VRIFWLFKVVLCNDSHNLYVTNSNNINVTTRLKDKGFFSTVLALTISVVPLQLFTGELNMIDVLLLVNKGTSRLLPPGPVNQIFLLLVLREPDGRSHALSVPAEGF